MTQRKATQSILNPLLSPPPPSLLSHPTASQPRLRTQPTPPKPILSHPVLSHPHPVLSPAPSHQHPNPRLVGIDRLSPHAPFQRPGGTSLTDITRVLLLLLLSFPKPSIAIRGRSPGIWPRVRVGRLTVGGLREGLPRAGGQAGGRAGRSSCYMGFVVATRWDMRYEIWPASLRAAILNTSARDDIILFVSWLGDRGVQLDRGDRVLVKAEEGGTVQTATRTRYNIILFCYRSGGRCGVGCGVCLLLSSHRFISSFRLPFPTFSFPSFPSPPRPPFLSSSILSLSLFSMLLS